MVIWWWLYHEWGRAELNMTWYSSSITSKFFLKASKRYQNYLGLEFAINLITNFVFFSCYKSTVKQILIKTIFFFMICFYINHHYDLLKYISCPLVHVKKTFNFIDAICWSLRKNTSISWLFLHERYQKIQVSRLFSCKECKHKVEICSHKLHFMASLQRLKSKTDENALNSFLLKRNFATKY